MRALVLELVDGPTTDIWAFGCVGALDVQGFSNSPMTYMVGGKRSIVVAVSGRQHPGELVALALPQSIRIRQTGSSRVV